jgi:hypothetical protein
MAPIAPKPASAQGAAPPVSIPLQCRLGDGPWQSCAMEVERPGERWSLVVGGRRIAFRHDGSGTVRIDDSAAQSRAGGHWRAVQTTWIAGPALCWNSICAQGDIPLD